jgi:thioredoxin reductase (NADPH)
MKKPIILVVDDDAQVLRAIERDLRSRYRKDYRILSAASGEEALKTVEELKLRNEEVALLLSDQRMPGMLGVDFLHKARRHYPQAKRILLTAYSDTNAAIRAINEVQLDYYLMKPWDPPEEKLYPMLDDQLTEWQYLYRPDLSSIRLIGYQWSPQTHAIKDFLAGNLIPYAWLDVEFNDKAKELLQLGELTLKDLPVLLFEDGTHLVKPTLTEVGNKVGLKAQASEQLYDVVIIGAGPAGLAAAVYGASEGLKTLLIERRAPGGQAGTSSRIENYLGFPNGLSGAELTHRAISQVQRFGAEFLAPQEVSSITLQDPYKLIKLADGSEVNARSIVITTGVNYRQLGAKNEEKFTGAGVYYGAANTEAYACSNKDVYVVGGGNSAGQAAMYLSKYARSVHILIRKPDLSSTMSQYLIDQINVTDNIKVCGHMTLMEINGNGHLESVTVENIKTGSRETVPAESVFIFIGAKPCTDWIESLSIIRNDRGYIETGRELMRYDDYRKKWKLNREPFLLESSIPGVFAAGDVRAGAMNRIASAVGEGAMSIKMVHEYLAEL